MSPAAASPPRAPDPWFSGRRAVRPPWLVRSRPAPAASGFPHRPPRETRRRLPCPDDPPASPGMGAPFTIGHVHSPHRAPAGHHELRSSPARFPRRPSAALSARAWSRVSWTGTGARQQCLFAGDREVGHQVKSWPLVAARRGAVGPGVRVVGVAAVVSATGMPITGHQRHCSKCSRSGHRRACPGGRDRATGRGHGAPVQRLQHCLVLLQLPQLESLQPKAGHTWKACRPIGPVHRARATAVAGADVGERLAQPRTFSSPGTAPRSLSVNRDPQDELRRRPHCSGSAPMRTNATVAGCPLRLRQACRVPFWITMSPAESGVQFPSSSSRTISPPSTMP